MKNIFKRIRCSVGGHVYGYREGDDVGQLSGDKRPLCHRRVCIDCEDEEEIINYSNTVEVNGRRWLTEPKWGKVNIRRDDEYE